MHIDADNLSLVHPFELDTSSGKRQNFQIIQILYGKVRVFPPPPFSISVEFPSVLMILSVLSLFKYFSFTTFHLLNVTGIQGFKQNLN